MTLALFLFGLGPLTVSGLLLGGLSSCGLALRGNVDAALS
jgi:hypothetical protein